MPDTAVLHAVPAPPGLRPANPLFASGPCAKRPGWSLEALRHARLARSHRAAGPKARIVEVIERSRALLGLPAGWRLGIVPASDTGAIEMALWSLLGPRPVDVLAFETFSRTWADDLVRQLRLDARILEAPYGRLPDLSAIDPAHDLVLTWNGTTSGVRIPDAGFIADDRAGLVIVDATSAVFAMHLPWDKLDAVTWSWQKVLGGEAAHGMLALSPRAVERLESWSPSWPLPKVFRLTSGGRLNEGLFRGDTINTPACCAWRTRSTRCAGRSRSAACRPWSRAARPTWPPSPPGSAAPPGEGGRWAAFLAENPATRSCTSICLRIVAPWFTRQDTDAQWRTIKRMAALLEGEGAAFDIAAHRDAGPGLRIWGGATVETSDIERLLPWLDWAFAAVTPP